MQYLYNFRFINKDSSPSYFFVTHTITRHTIIPEFELRNERHYIAEITNTTSSGTILVLRVTQHNYTTSTLVYINN